MWFVSKIQLGTPTMCEKGIYARASIDVYTDKPDAGGQRWISINDVCIRYSRDKQEYFATLPSRSYKVGNETKYANTVFLFPDQRELYGKWQKSIVEDYFAECKKQGVAPGSPGSGNSGSGNGGHSAPAQAAPAPAPNRTAVPAPAPAPAPAPPPSGGGSDVPEAVAEDIPF